MSEQSMIEIQIPAVRVNALVELFGRMLNQSEPVVLAVTAGAYIEAVVDEILSEVCPAIKDTGHVRKLRVLRDQGVIDESAFQGAVSFAHFRNSLAHRFTPASLEEPDIKKHLSTFLGLLEKHVPSASLRNAIQSKVQAEALRLLGVDGGVHAGYTTDEGERMKAALFCLAFHFLAIRHALPQRPTPLNLGGEYTIRTT
jgi:hypothetical protein